MSSTEGESQGRGGFPILLVLGGFAVLDLCAAMALRPPMRPAVGGAIFGLLVGQFELLAIWAALGPERGIVRLWRTMLTMLALLAILILGLHLGDPAPPRFRNEFAQSVLLCPLLLLAAQSPLWIARIATGCRLVRSEDAIAAGLSASRQFGLRDLLATTAAVAAALGLPLSFYERPPQPVGLAEVASLIAACGSCGLWTAFTALPCLWAVFGARRKTLAVLAVALLAVLVTFAILVIIGLIGGRGDTETRHALYATQAVLIVVLLGVLHLARLRGYVLVRTERGGAS